jgi:hypothetical protein
MSHLPLLEAIARRDAIQSDLDAAALDVSRALYNLNAEGESHTAIAALLGLTRQRVGQLIARAERELREAYELEGIDNARAVRTRGKRSGLQGGRVQPRCRCNQFVATVNSRCTRCGDMGPHEY